MSPAFQVTHSFALGSQTAPSSYNFGAVYASDAVRAVMWVGGGGALTLTLLVVMLGPAARWDR